MYIKVCSCDTLTSLAGDGTKSTAIILTHCGLVKPYGNISLDQHWLRLPEPILTNQKCCLSVFICGEILQEMLKIFILYMSLKLSNLTLTVRGLSYLGLTRSISRLLMPWLLTSPGHQQPWYWLCRICRSWSYFRKDFEYLCHINVELWHKM